MRIVSPFQHWLVKEVVTNARSSINVLTERDQVMPPNSGLHLTLFANYTLDGTKVVLVLAIDSETGSPCGLGRAHSHSPVPPSVPAVLVAFDAGHVGFLR